MASGLTSLSLPETTRLGYSAFQHCDALTELRLTAAGNITLEMDSGATLLSPNFAKVCDLTLNRPIKRHSTSTAWHRESCVRRPMGMHELLREIRLPGRASLSSDAGVFRYF
ncbi:MAG: hypothetical protein ACLUYV_04800 [Alistipes shahii]